MSLACSYTRCNNLAVHVQRYTSGEQIDWQRPALSVPPDVYRRMITPAELASYSMGGRFRIFRGCD